MNVYMIEMRDFSKLLQHFLLSDEIHAVPFST